MHIPYLTADLPGTGGLIKAAPEDFIVEEIPAYPPSGEGAHLFLTVEKRGISTQEMVRRVARALSVPPTAIGVAGQKDQQAITRQVISVPAPETPEATQRTANLKLDGVTILAAARHRHKLRTGHLRGNRFTITLRGVTDGGEARARAILERLETAWLPNFFGAQRFGRGEENVRLGRALLRGERAPHDRFKRRFLISAYQSALFNRYLTARMDEGALFRVIDGEVLQRAQTGGLFACPPDEVMAAQVRLERREIVPTGPIFGHKMMQPLPGTAAAARERRILDEEGVLPEHFARFSKIAEGTRRPLLARIEGASVQADGDHLILSFSLPSGTYATVLLGEVMKSTEPETPAIETPEGSEAGDGEGGGGDGGDEPSA